MDYNQEVKNQINKISNKLALSDALQEYMIQKMKDEGHTGKDEEIIKELKQYVKTTRETNKDSSIIWFYYQFKTKTIILVGFDFKKNKILKCV